MAKKSTSQPKASNTVHAFDFLKGSSRQLPRGVCALFGGQRFLKLQVLKSLSVAEPGDDFSESRFDASAEWAQIMDELRSQSLFGGGQDKRVIVDNADDFVKKYREKIEGVAEEKNVVGTLILVVDAWPANTRLYKILDKSSMQIQCDLPQVKRGKGVSVDTAKLTAWLAQHAKSAHKIDVEANAIHLLCDLTENDLGRIDTELGKISLYVKQGEVVTQDHIKKHVGGWRTQTMWEANEAIISGRTSEALLLIDRLLKAGEHPLALYGQMAWALRRYPKAIAIYDRMKAKSGGKPPVRDALLQAGFRAWGDETSRAEANMRRLGKRKIENLGNWILQTDLALKRSHSREERARVALEKLVFWLNTEA
ncbi:MAG: DNA polymerase III subunit delta [Pirellulaceae bacterium]